MEYATIRLVHIGCATLSITLFVLRGGLQFAGVQWRRWRWLRVAPHINDTVLLSAAIALSWISHQYPWQQPWLGAKVGALLLYILLGRLAFRPGADRRQQFTAFLAALAMVTYIVLVATNRSPAAGLLPPA